MFNKEHTWNLGDPTPLPEIEQPTGEPLEVKEEKKKFKDITGRVDNCRLVNVRKEPKYGNNIIGTIPSGRTVTLIEEEDKKSEFYHIRSQDISDGYICKKFVVFHGYNKPGRG